MVVSHTSFIWLRAFNFHGRLYSRKSSPTRKGFGSPGNYQIAW
jgi:hypothetical protein